MVHIFSGGLVIGIFRSLKYFLELLFLQKLFMQIHQHTPCCSFSLGKKCLWLWPLFNIHQNLVWFYLIQYFHSEVAVHLLFRSGLCSPLWMRGPSLGIFPAKLDSLEYRTFWNKAKVPGLILYPTEHKMVDCSLQEENMRLKNWSNLHCSLLENIMYFSGPNQARCLGFKGEANHFKSSKRFKKCAQHSCIVNNPMSSCCALSLPAFDVGAPILIVQTWSYCLWIWWEDLSSTLIVQKSYFRFLNSFLGQWSTFVFLLCDGILNAPM